MVDAVKTYNRQELLEMIARKDALRELEERVKKNPMFYWKPLDPPSKQKEFISSEKSILTAFGGNRSGKSEGGAYKVIDESYRRGGETRVWCATTEYQTSVRVQQRKIWNLIPKADVMGNGYDPSKGFTDACLKLKNKTVFFFKSYEAGRQAFQADDIDIMWFDEEPPMSIFNETKMRLIDRRGKMIITMTSLSGFTEFVKTFYGRVDATHDFFVLDTYHNSKLRKDEIDSLTKDMTEEEKQARLHGVPLMRSGLVFKEWNDRTPWVVPTKTIREDDYGAYTFYVGIDTHLKLPTYAVLVAVDGSGTHFVLDEICVAGSIGNFIDEYKARWGMYPIVDVFIDPSSISIEGKVGASSIVEELDNADINVTPAIKDPAERIRILGKGFKPLVVQDGILAGANVPTIQICDNCEKLREQLRWYVWDDYSGSKIQDRKEEKDAPRKKNDHLIDALGYLECAVAGLIMEYEKDKVIYKEESVLSFEDYI